MILGEVTINTKIINFIIVSFVFSLLSACGGGSDNSSTLQNTAKQYQGFVQKGPFDVGTDVVISLLNSSGVSTGESIKTKIEDLSGRFTYQLPNDWKVGADASSLRISAEGFFFGEFNGLRSNKKIKLSSITNTPESSSVNLLTNWVVNRTEALIKNGQSVKSATEQSEKELINVFGIDNIHQLDIAQLDSFSADNALLLLLSGALMEVAEQNAIDPQQISNEISSDFSDDGMLTELGDDWFVRMQSIISNKSRFKINQYAKNLREKHGLDAPTGKELPEVIKLESRPSAILPKEIIVEPGASVVLDGRESHDNPLGSGGVITNYTWFVRGDQNEHNILFSERNSANPTITVPDEEIELIFALVVTNSQKLTDTSIMKVIVKATNNPPVAVDDTKSTNEDTPITLSVDDIVTTNDTDEDGDTLRITMVSNSINGEAHLFSTGLVTFTPIADFFGVASFDYTISDGKDGADTATVTINVTAVNDKPVITSTAGATATEDVAYIYTPTAIDLDGDNLTWAVSGQPTGMTIVASTGAISWTPVEGITTSGLVTITVTDNGIGNLTDTQAFTVSVGAVNDAPIAVNDTYSVDQDSTLVFNPLDGDSDIEGDTLSIISINATLLNGGVQIIPVNDGTVNIDASGVISFIPSANFVGNIIFPYVISDGNSGTDSAVVSIDVEPTPVVGYFKSSNTTTSDEYGYSVSMSADGATLAVGGGQAGDNIDPKLVLIYSLGPAGWSLQSTLTSLNFTVNDYFGTSLSISNDGNTLIVGAPGEDSSATGVGGADSNDVSGSGAAYVFTRVGTTWSQTAYLKASNTQSGDQFGSAVSISGNGKTVAVGAPFEDSALGGVNADQSNNGAVNSGAAYIFKLTGTSWAQDAYVKASVPQASHFFGLSLSLDDSGDSLLIGAPGYGVSVANSGAVFYFEKNGSAWSQNQLINASNPVVLDYFGFKVALSNDGNTFAASAPAFSSLGSGSVSVFNKNISWDEEAVISANNSDPDDKFGLSIAISTDGNRLVVGAPNEDSNAIGTMLRNGADPSNNGKSNSGAVYIFDRVGIQWAQYDYVKASNTDIGDGFGFGVTLSDDGSSIAVGAPSEDNQASGVNPGTPDDNSISNAGAVYVNPHYYNVP